MRLKLNLIDKNVDTLATALLHASQIFSASEDENVILKFGAKYSDRADSVSVTQHNNPNPQPNETFFTCGFVGRNEKPEVWLRLRSDVIFKDLICESLRENAIDITVVPQNILNAFKYASKMKQTSVRLGRGDGEGGILVWDFRYWTTPTAESPDSTSRVFVVVQNIPVNVVRRTDDIKEEPSLPPPDISVELVRLSKIRGAVEKFKEMKIQTILLSLSADGTLMISGSSDDSEIESCFGIMPILGEVRNADTSVWLNTSKLLPVLSHFSQIPLNGNPIMMISRDFYLCLWCGLDLSLGTISCVLPALVL